MADNQNFFQEEPEKEQNEQAPTKIKLGETEYTQEELDKLVGLGRKAEEYQAKYNTDFDKAWSAYGKTTQANKELEERIRQYEAKERAGQSQPQPQQTGDLTPEQIQMAKTQLKAIMGDDLVTNKQFAQLFVTYRQSEKLIEECEDYESEINGTDGRPKFDKDVILAHMSATGIKKPMAAYNDLYEKEIETWKTNKLSEASPTRMVTQETAPAEKQPQQVRAKNESDLVKMLTESLNTPSGF